MPHGRGVLAVMLRESCLQQRRLHEPEKAFVKIVRHFQSLELTRCPFPH